MTDPTALIPQPQPSKDARRRRGAPIVLASLLAGLVGGLGGGVLVQTFAPEPVSPRAEAPAPAVATPVTSMPVEGTIPALSRAALPSVALISIGPGGRDGQGSGFVIREDGYVLTNHHVIAASTSGGGITVQLPGLEPANAEIVGSDSIYDIAVLRVDLSGLAPLTFADSEVVEVGQTVVAVGAPLGLDSTVTSGIVSALDRPVVTGGVADQSYISAIQTDAAINPGNSGGPLLDLAGRVVGVNSAIAQIPSALGVSSGSIGLGFAIPAEQAERTATQIIQTGKSQHPVIGVHIDLQYTGEGARVLSQSRDGIDPVVPEGPADVAGVEPGDIIVAVDGKRITDSTHLLVVLRSHAIGESVEMVLRGIDGAERTVSMRLAGSGD